MQLECTEQIAIRVPPGTEKAVGEVAARRAISPDEYLRRLVLKELQKHTGFSAIARAREIQQDGARRMVA